jgi:hypothetical protein
MSPKIKVFVVYGVSFLVIYMVAYFIIRQFIEEGVWTTMIPIGASIVFAPKPHIESTQSGKNYGLKSIFSKKIIRF